MYIDHVDPSHASSKFCSQSTPSHFPPNFMFSLYNYLWGVVCLFLNSLGLINITFIHVEMGSFSEARTTFQRPHVGENDFLSFGSSTAHSFSPRGAYLRARPHYLIEFLTGLGLCQSWVVVTTSVSAEVVL